MKYCIPDELFNTIQYPIEGVSDTNISGIVGEMIYKMPKAPDVVLKKETWHSVCDFCYRTGALLERKQESAQSIELNPVYGRFLRIVGATTGGIPTSDFAVSASANNKMQVTFPASAINAVVYSAAPKFDDDRNVNSAWSPRVPRYVIDRYGECIAHGALMRLYAMANQPWADINLARMHAVSYNNDLNRFSFGLITSGMRKHLLVDIEDFLIQANANGNG